MSGTGTERTIFGDEAGTDGRAITDTDLNAIGNSATRRAWEVPGYAELIAFDQIADPSYDSVFGGGASIMSLKSGVFTRGGGLAPSAGGAMSTVLGAGVIGIWKETGGPTPPAQDGIAKMMWMYVTSAAAVSAEHADVATGFKRWDLVTCTIAEVDIAAVARDYQDAVTGVITSENVVTAKTMSLTVTVTTGTPQNDDSEIPPAIPSGQHVLYAVHLDGDAGGADVAGIDLQLDCTIPVGVLRRQLQPGQAGTWTDTSWEVTNAHGAIASKHTDTLCESLFFPPVAGNGEARVVGVRIVYELAADSYCGLVKTTPGDLSPTELVDLSSELTMDGAKHETFIDLHGLPSDADYGPFWAAGGQAKEQNVSGTSLALHVTGPASDQGSNIVWCVEWFYLGG